MDEATRTAADRAPWQPGTWQPGTWQPGTWQHEPWRRPEPTTNRVAVWSWVVALPCALLGVVLGVVGLVRAHRRGGVGLAHAVVGTAVSAVVLLVGAVAGAVALAVAGGWAAGTDLPGTGRGHDGSVASVSADEQSFLDGLWDETWQSYDDATLLEMGYGFCADLDSGLAPPEADAALVERWSDVQLDLDAAYDVEWEATSSLCPAHGEEFSAWDPAVTDGSAAVTREV